MAVQHKIDGSGVVAALRPGPRSAFTLDGFTSADTTERNASMLHSHPVRRSYGRSLWMGLSDQNLVV